MSGTAMIHPYFMLTGTGMKVHGESYEVHGGSYED